MEQTGKICSPFPGYPVPGFHGFPGYQSYPGFFQGGYPVIWKPEDKKDDEKKCPCGCGNYRNINQMGSGGPIIINNGPSAGGCMPGGATYAS
jgi:hypothetical protein